MPTLFTLAEAQALQGNLLYAKQDFKDELERLLIPQTSVCRVIGLDAWPASEDDPTPLAIDFLNEMYIMTSV